MFAVCNGKEVAENVIEALRKVYRTDEKANYYISKSDLLGTRRMD